MIKIGVEQLNNHKGHNTMFVLDDMVLNRDNINLVNVKRKEYFDKQGYEYNTLDMYKSPKEVDYIIYSGYDKKRWLKAFFGGYSNKVIYYMNEPSAVLPMYSTKGIKIIKNAYRYIMNWSDKVVDNDRIVKTSFGFIFAKLKNDVPTSDKNLLTMIAGCKTSKHPNELYSERVKIINYFESKHSKDFELYGTGWENAGLECYKGSCDSKHSVYEKFKFAVSLENQIGDTGDFSEKIFDCFNSGIVPIYLMAEQNKKYIPADTYIDYAQFKSVEDMESFLKDMTDEEYNGYLEAAQRYVNSPLKEIIEPEFYCKQVIKIIERDKENPYKLALYKKIYFSIFAAVTTVLSKLHINWEKSLY